MIPNLDPKKMQSLMKQMGLTQSEIDAERVIIEKKEGGRLIINNPEVLKIKIQGNESFQITGEVLEEKFDEKDIEMIIEKTHCSKKEAETILRETGDLAEAILRLSK
ncbi:Nascent polypeptide-associated complex protein [Candidatus Woesearchaeota archaeon]|nr:Nascent polypeptide-associated complex protein [Candidatus Woesearchaeota archaeon]